MGQGKGPGEGNNEVAGSDRADTNTHEVLLRSKAISWNTFCGMTIIIPTIFAAGVFMTILWEGTIRLVGASFLGASMVLAIAFCAACCVLKQRHNQGVREQRGQNRVSPIPQQQPTASGYRRLNRRVSRQNSPRCLQSPAIYDQNPSGYGQYPPVHDQNPPSYEQNLPVYDQNSPSYGQYPPVYDQTPLVHGINPSVYEQKAAGYNQNPPGYNQNPPGYDQNSPVYDQNPLSYQQNPPEHY